MIASLTLLTTAPTLLVGDSHPMREIEKEILLTAGGDITVLITGESGAGKELVAQSIHRNSKRASGPFKAINCGSLTETLLEARLFGHVKGAFTGASGAQSGLFEAANGGTIFLDEIGDMDERFKFAEQVNSTNKAWSDFNDELGRIQKTLYSY